MNKPEYWFGKCGSCETNKKLNYRWMACNDCMDELTQHIIELCEIETNKYLRMKEDAIDISQYYTDDQIQLMEGVR